MFYTLSTKIPNIMTGKKLLKIFTVGSICYIVSNYFLQLNKSSEKLKIINKYFYYAMAIDLVIASILIKFHKSEELEDDDANNQINKTVEEVIKIQNENNVEKIKPQKSDKSSEKSENSDESEKPEESVQDDSESVSLSLSSNKKNKKLRKEKEKEKNNKKDKHAKKHKKQSQNTDTDTQIPVFVNS